ncbi:hypothetical protein CORC01_14222 [Colletotrichum orchidophilum]|uniref:Uncharacterized protein n=1 Tax=Colletotrichum orchidophilum TaxID=1209926 RepID=A0A1G4AMY1_9PEZI|nr:uncharacterized protein CORC01_14222 [Colletotrichum orchidophilum]OHE90481.1 hypothetical protein CORC01_14222 [Colletotrichum orchidophilum]
MNDGRCTNYIKNYDPKEFRFCSQYHNCLQQGCANQRNHPNGVDYRYCPDHRCDHQDCTNPKASPSSFCASHTCAAPSCLARCPGATGDPHDASRHCDRHRMCAAAGCRRFAHVSERGVTSAHCGEHYCKFEPACNNGRAEDADETCAAHTCEERGCTRPKTRHRRDAGRYCKRHECETDDCWERKWLDKCKTQQPAAAGQAAIPESSTEARYQNCAVVGCQQLRVPMVLSQTMMMFGGFNRAGGLNLPLSPYCQAHACGHEGCTERADAEGDSRFCTGHARCRQPGCTNGVEVRGRDRTLCEEHNRGGLGGMGRRGMLDPDAFGWGGGGGGGGGGHWSGFGPWGVNAAI